MRTERVSRSAICRLLRPAAARDDLPLPGGEFAEYQSGQRGGAGALAASGEGGGPGPRGAGGPRIAVDGDRLGARLGREQQESAPLQLVGDPVERGSVRAREGVGVRGEDAGQPADRALGRAEPDGVVRVAPAGRPDRLVEVAARGGGPGDGGLLATPRPVARLRGGQGEFGTAVRVVGVGPQALAGPGRGVAQPPPNRANRARSAAYPAGSGTPSAASHSPTGASTGRTSACSTRRARAARSASRAGPVRSGVRTARRRARSRPAAARSTGPCRGARGARRRGRRR